MLTDNFFKLPSYDSSSDEDEVQQHSSSNEASREYMDPDLIPDWSSEEEDTEKEEEDEDDNEEEDEPEHDDDDH